MNLTFLPGPPTFVISYDHINRSISAHFSHPYPDHILPVEQEAMDIIASQFTTLLAPSFIHQMVNAATLRRVSAQNQQIINHAYQQTGVQFVLDDKGLASFSPIKRYS